MNREKKGTPHFEMIETSWLATLVEFILAELFTQQGQSECNKEHREELCLVWFPQHPSYYVHAKLTNEYHTWFSCCWCQSLEGDQRPSHFLHMQLVCSAEKNTCTNIVEALQ